MYEMSNDVHLGRTGAALGTRYTDASAAIESSKASVMMQAVNPNCCVAASTSLVLVGMMALFSERTPPFVV